MQRDSASASPSLQGPAAAKSPSSNPSAFTSRSAKEVELVSSPSSHTPSLIDDPGFSDISSLDEEDYEFIGDDPPVIQRSLSALVESMPDSLSWMDSEASTELYRQSTLLDSDSTHGRDGQDSLKASLHATSISEAFLDTQPLHQPRRNLQGHDDVFAVSSVETPRFEAPLRPMHDPLTPTVQDCHVVALTEDDYRADIQSHNSLHSPTSSDYLFPDPNNSQTQSPASVDRSDLEPRRKILEWLSQPAHAPTHGPACSQSAASVDGLPILPCQQNQKSVVPSLRAQATHHRYLWMHWLVAFLLGFGGALWASQQAAPSHVFRWTPSLLSPHKEARPSPWHNSSLLSHPVVQSIAVLSAPTTSRTPSVSTAKGVRAAEKHGLLSTISYGTKDVSLYRSHGRDFSLQPRPAANNAVLIDETIDSGNGGNILHKLLGTHAQSLRSSSNSQFRTWNDAFQPTWRYVNYGTRCLQEDARDEWQYWKGQLEQIWLHYIVPAFRHLVTAYDDAKKQQKEFLEIVRHNAVAGATLLRRHAPHGRVVVSDWCRSTLTPVQFEAAAQATMQRYGHLTQRAVSFAKRQAVFTREQAGLTVRDAARGAFAAAERASQTYKRSRASLLNEVCTEKASKLQDLKGFRHYWQPLKQHLKAVRARSPPQGRRDSRARNRSRGRHLPLKSRFE